MLRRTAPLLLAIPLLAAFAPAPKRGKEDDAKAVQGTWKMTRLVHAGRYEKEAVEGITKVTVKGDRLEIHEAGEVELRKITLDSRKRPKEITLVPVNEPGVVPREVYPRPGIYKLEKDTWTICLDINPRGAVRPKEFASKAGSTHTLLVLQRLKP
jgi:uncharacterized protein (TIGR03067 family)